MSLKTRPHVFTALGLGSTVPPHRPARLVAMGRGESKNPRLLVPRRRLPSLKLSRHRLDRC
jgi:hypothetical protein